MHPTHMATLNQKPCCLKTIATSSLANDTTQPFATMLLDDDPKGETLSGAWSEKTHMTSRVKPWYIDSSIVSRVLTSFEVEECPRLPRNVQKLNVGTEDGILDAAVYWITLISRDYDSATKICCDPKVQQLSSTKLQTCRPTSK